jgi:hypothetical protein
MQSSTETARVPSRDLDSVTSGRAQATFAVGDATTLRSGPPLAPDWRTNLMKRQIGRCSGYPMRSSRSAH